MRRLLVSFMMVVMAITLMPSPGSATEQLLINLNRVVKSDPGTTTLLKSVAVPDDIIGKKCHLSAQAENQDSVHPGNDLIVASGDETVTLSNVEREGDVRTPPSGGTYDFSLGTTLNVSLVMGGDGVFSAGIMVRLLECEKPTPSFNVEVECPPEGGGTVTLTVTNHGDTVYTVSLQNQKSGESFESTTDAEGRAVIENIPDSTYEVHVGDDHKSIYGGEIIIVDCVEPKPPVLAATAEYAQQCVDRVLQVELLLDNTASVDGDQTSATAVYEVIERNGPNESVETHEVPAGLATTVTKAIMVDQQRTVIVNVFDSVVINQRFNGATCTTATPSPEPTPSETETIGRVRVDCDMIHVNASPSNTPFTITARVTARGAGAYSEAASNTTGDGVHVSLVPGEYQVRIQGLDVIFVQTDRGVLPRLGNLTFTVAIVECPEHQQPNPTPTPEVTTPQDDSPVVPAPKPSPPPVELAATGLTQHEQFMLVLGLVTLAIGTLLVALPALARRFPSKRR